MNKQGKWKKRMKKKTKCKKSTRTRWWCKIRKSFASDFTRKMKTKDEKEEKRCRSKARHSNARKCPSSPCTAEGSQKGTAVQFKEESSRTGRIERT